MVAFADRVRETTLTTGTGTITLSGVAPTQYQRFQDAFPGGAQVYYVISGNSSDATNEWEVGIGTFTAPTTLTRDTVLSSSNGGAKVNFSAATKDVFLDFPGEGVWPPANVNVNVSAGAASNNLGSVVFSNGNNVSFGLAGSTITASASVASTQGSITVSGGASSAAISAITFSNANGVTFGFDKTNISASINSTSAVGLNTALTANGVAWTVNSSGISLNVPAFLTTADLSQNSSKYAGINGAITGGSITVNTSGVSVNLPAYLTTAMQSNAATISNINISAGASSSNVSAVTFSNANNVSFGYDKTNITASANPGVSAIADAGGHTVAGGLIEFSNSNGVSFGLNGSTMTGSHALNVSAAGGTSNALSGLTFSNGNGISFGLSTGAGVGTLTASIATSLSVVNFSAGANSGNLGSVVFSNSNGVSFGLNGSTITATVAPAGATLSSYQNFNLLITASALPTLMKQSTSYCQAFVLPQYGSFSFIRIPVQMIVTSSGSNFTSSNTFTSGGGFAYSTWNAVVYAPGTGANSASLVSIASGSAGWTIQNSFSFSTNNSAWSVTQAYTGQAYGNQISGSQQYSQTSASLLWSTNLLSNFSSNRLLDINFANSLTPGNYVMVIGVSTSSTTSGQVNTNIAFNFQGFNANLALEQNNAWINALGDTAGSSGMGLFGVGSFTTNGAAGTTASLGFSNISSFASNPIMIFQMLRSA